MQLAVVWIVWTTSLAVLRSKQWTTMLLLAARGLLCRPAGHDAMVDDDCEKGEKPTTTNKQKKERK